MDIPEYYRKYQIQPQAQPEPAQTQKPVRVIAPPLIFKADAFTINLYEDWQDNTIYALTGPVSGGVEHNIIITIDREVEVDSLAYYAEWQVRSLEEELKACRVLLKEEIRLNNGMAAYHAVFSWYPTDDLRIYQEQIYVLVDTTAYKLTASFTKKTRKTLGPQVKRMMLSFNPRPAMEEKEDGK